MKKIVAFFLLAICLRAFPASVTYNITNGQLLHPSNFFLTHVLPGDGMIAQYGVGSNTLTLRALTNSPTSPGILPPYVTNSIWYNGAWVSPTSVISVSPVSTFTIDESTATNIWDNGIIRPINDGSGNFSLEYGNESLGTNKISIAFYEWLLSNFGSGGGTTNGFGVNGTFRTDWNFINSAAIAATLSAGTNWYLSIENGAISTNKLDAQTYALLIAPSGSGETNTASNLGTSSSTNQPIFKSKVGLDLQFRQVAAGSGITIVSNANEIVIASTATGGGETNTASNLGTASSTNQPLFKAKSGVDLQFRTLAVGPNLTLASNANEVVLGVTLSTNSGTVVSVDGGSSLTVVNHADSSEVDQTLTGTNLQASLIDGSISTNKLNTTAHGLLVTGTLKTGTNVIVNGSLVQPARFTNNAAETGGVVIRTNASGDIVMYATNFPSGSGGGTNIKANGVLVNNANLTNSPTVVVNVSGSDISFTVTNVAGSTTSNVLQRTGIAVFDIYDAGTDYDIRNLYTSGCITNVNMQSGNESTQGRLNISLTSRGTTNYFVSSEIEGSYGDGNGGPVGFVEQNTRTSSYFDYIIFGTAGSATPQARVSIIIMEPVSVGGSGDGGDAYLGNTQTFTGASNIFSADVHIGGVLNVATQNVDRLIIGQADFGTNIIGLANGGTSATNAAGARAALGADNASNITSGTLAEARIDSAIARLDSPAFTNSPTAPTAPPGTSNSVLATTAFVRQNAGTGSGSFTNRPNRKRLVLFEKDWVTLTPANSALPELVGTAVSSGSAAVIASESNHLGLLRLSSSATPNSAYYFLSSILGLFAQPVLTWESISRVRATNSGVSISHGFTDSATIANPTDAIRMYRSNNFLIPQIWNNGSVVQGFEYPVDSNQFVYLRFQVQPSMTNVTFYAEDSDTKTLILSTNLNSTLPSDSNRSFGVGHLAASTNSVALTLEDLDWSTAYIEGEVDR